MLSKSKIWMPVAAPVIIAILAGSSSPWWMQLFAADHKNEIAANSTPPANQNQPAKPEQTTQPAEPSRRHDGNRANRSPVGNWSGEFSTQSGAYLTGKLLLTDTGAGSVEGQIEWTLRTSKVAEKADKIGKSAIEYIKGSFDPRLKSLKIDGHEVSDPNNIFVVGKDSYRLQMTADGQYLNGQARNGGKWNATVKFRRD